MAATTLDAPSSTRSPSRWLAPLAVAVAAWGASRVFPLASPLIVALAVGAVVANTSAARAPVLRGSADAAKLLLRLGVALLGLRLAVSDLTQLGTFGVVLVLATVAATFALTRAVGLRMGIEPDLVSLIASGFAVCGAAAIAAVQDSVKAKENLVGLALALITLHGTVMIALIPYLGHLLGLPEEATSIWAGASIHEVAQVAAAAALIGPGALAVAMSVKLGRVLMLAPVHHTVSRLHHASGAHFLREIPWFLYAFVGAVVLRATGLVPAQVLTVANHASTVGLAAGMFGLGLGIVVKDLWPIPGRVIVLSGIATCTVTVVPLLLLIAAGRA